MQPGDTSARHGVSALPTVTPPGLLWLAGRRGCPFLLVPGLVPDGPETFARQLPLLRRFGDVTLMSYPRRHFDLDGTLATMQGLIERAANAGKAPVLVGTSVGGGFCVELLQRCRAAGVELPLTALVLISPMCSAGDLAPLLRRLLEPILTASDVPASHRAVERGRAFFRGLARKAGSPRSGREEGWTALVGRGRSMAAEDSRLKARIMATINAISPEGAVERCRALGELAGLDPSPRPAPLTRVPTLILWGSKERHTLDMNGPGPATLSRPDLACRYFPQVEVQWVYAAGGIEVPHASLVVHHQAFNAILRPFLTRCGRGSARSKGRLFQLARPALTGSAPASAS